VVKQKRAGLPIRLSVDRETIELAPEEVLVGVQPLQGLAVAHDKGLTVAVDVVITPGLRAEGLVRDMVRHVQTLRKTADYRLDQRITLGLFDLSETAHAAVRAFEAYLCAETLCATLLTDDDGGSWDQRKRVTLGGSDMELAVRR
jgi:isoleucyl-tRNA synthetase